jgi:hypothetical protein
MVIKIVRKLSVSSGEMYMGRPRKSGDLLMNVPLRIMLTTEQKGMIDEAARLEGLDTSTWARPILLGAARLTLAKSQTGKKQKK